MDLITFSYFLLGNIILISALVVVSAKNPIHRIAALVIVFTAGAFIFMILDFYFLGLTYIIVYVGAIAILFLFVIMMINISSDKDINNINFNNIKKEVNKDELYLANKNIEMVENYKSNYNSNYSNKNIRKFSIFFAIIILINLPIFISIYNSNENIYLSNYIFSSETFSPISIYTYFYPSWAIEYKTITDIESLGVITYVAYPTALILVGIALWTVMIGIISICSPRI